MNGTDRRADCAKTMTRNTTPDGSKRATGSQPAQVNLSSDEIPGFDDGALLAPLGGARSETPSQAIPDLMLVADVAKVFIATRVRSGAG